VITDLRLCRLMHWSYDDLLDLPADVYAVLVEEINREAAGRSPSAPRPDDPVPWP
jgi:hypothetical protein